MPGRPRHLNESGASVIIGTLMLILVIVIGASAIALMMSTAQKEEMNRQAHQNAVKNEKLDIDRIVLVPNATIPDRWAFVNFTIENLDINDATVTIVGLYDQASKGYRYPTNVTAGSPGPVTLYNLMQDSGIPRYADSSGGLLRIPGKKSLTVSINLSYFTDPMVIGRGEEIRIILDTLLLNNFEKRFIPPTPMIKITVESQDLSIGKRDYLLLDGTGSTDDGSITSWNWAVDNANPPYDPKYYVGKTVEVWLPSQGPFTVNLTVTDDTQMKSISQNYQIPLDPQFDPATRVTGIYTNPVITAIVTSFNGLPFENAPINFVVQSGTISLTPQYGTTNNNGLATTNVSGSGGIVKIVSGNLPGYYVTIP